MLEIKKLRSYLLELAIKNCESLNHIPKIKIQFAL